MVDPTQRPSVDSLIAHLYSVADQLGENLDKALVRGVGSCVLLGAASCLLLYEYGCLLYTHAMRRLARQPWKRKEGREG